MFNNISWASYWYALSVLLACYYAVVVALFYRTDIWNFLKGKRLFLAASLTSLQKKAVITASVNGRHNELSDQEAAFSAFEEPLPSHNLTPVAQAAIDELRAYLQQARHMEAGKEELTFSLQQILQKYQALIGSPLQNSINHFIIQECENICSIHLNEEGVKGLW